MALTILPYNDRSPVKSIKKAEAFKEAIQQGIGVWEKQKEKAESKALLEKENEAWQKQGVDLYGITDPKMRQAAVTQALKSKGQKEAKAEENKFLSELFQGKKNNKEKEVNALTRGEPEEISTKQEVPEEGFNPSNLSDEEIARAEIMRHGLGTTLGTQKAAAEKKITGKEKETRRQMEADRAFHSKTSEPVLESANALLREEPVKKGLNAQLRRDISSGNTSGLIPFLVDRMGIESFRNPESARFTSEIKNKFVASLADIPGARPNMFLERILSTAQPQIGRSEEANLSVLDLADFVDDLNYERAKQIRNIAKEDRKTLGYVRNDVEERAEEKMGDYANKRQEKMAYDIRKRHEDQIKDDTDLLDEIVGKTIPEGSPVTRRVMRLLMIKNGDDAQKAVKEAKNLGMVFPSKETYERHEN